MDQQRLGIWNKWVAKFRRRRRNCLECGRPLRHKSSLFTGYGPTCAKKYAERIAQESLEREGQIRIEGL